MFQEHSPRNKAHASHTLPEGNLHMLNSPCGVCLMLSEPPTLMQFTAAGLAISVAGGEAAFKGVQPQVARARAHKVAIRVGYILISL
jgi:hypothetical protein